MRLIDADALPYENQVMSYDDEWCLKVSDIDEAPTIDPKDLLPHGRWVNAPLCGNDNCRCSNCGSWHNIHANLRGEINYKYCPNCGAIMDLEE